MEKLLIWQAQSTQQATVSDMVLTKLFCCLENKMRDFKKPVI